VDHAHPPGEEIVHEGPLERSERRGPSIQGLQMTSLVLNEISY
jgi:hypothetical protein